MMFLLLNLLPLHIQAQANENIWQAAENNNLVGVIFALRENPNVNATNDLGQTPLMIAAKNGYAEVAKLLIEKEADVNLRDYEGQTALSYATYFHHQKLAQLLIEAGANENSTPQTPANGKSKHVSIPPPPVKKNETPVVVYDWSDLKIAAKKGEVKKVRRLIEQSIDIHRTDDQGWTALMFAVQEGHQGVVELLIEQSADVNVRGEEGWTPLMLAALEGDVQIVKLLIEAGANINAKNDYDWSVYMFAILSKNNEIIQILENAGIQ